MYAVRSSHRSKYRRPSRCSNIEPIECAAVALSVIVKMRRSTIRPIHVSAVWKVPDDLAQTRIALGRIEYAPLLASCLEGIGVDQDKSRNSGDRALVLPAVGYTAHDDDFTLLHGYDLSAVELDIDLA